MAIIDTLKLRNIMVDGDIAEEAASQAFVTALDETFEEQLSGLVTNEDVHNLGVGLRGETAQMGAELIAEMRAMETRLTRLVMYVAFGLFTALAALMTLFQVFLN